MYKNRAGEANASRAKRLRAALRFVSGPSRMGLAADQARLAHML